MDGTAIATFVLAAVTVGLAYTTVRLELAWKKGFDQQVGLQTWFHFQARFDARDMEISRSVLASQLQNYTEAKHAKVNEAALALFEDLGTVWRLKLINKDLAESSFSYYVTRWWRVAAAYVQRERQRNDDDRSLFKDFEDLAKEWAHLVWCFSNGFTMADLF